MLQNLVIGYVVFMTVIVSMGVFPNIWNELFRGIDRMARPFAYK